MKHLVLVLLLLPALATSLVFLISRGAEASPDATITVNSTADTNARDEQMTLREAMLLATGGLDVNTLDEGECYQISNSTYGPPCSTTDTVGAASADTIVFDTFIFPPSSPRTITLSSTLPVLSTGSDTVDASAAGVRALTQPIPHDCFEITSNTNTIKGIDYLGCTRGVYIHGTAQGNVIGGITTPGQCDGDCNGILGNSVGVEISGAGTSGNVVKGNYLYGALVASPTPPATPTPTGSNPRVLMREGAHNNMIGGSAAGEGNTVRNAWDAAVRVDGATTTGNSIRGNSIGAEIAKGIENMNGGNLELAPPIIDSVGGPVSGHTNPKCYPCAVDVFSDDDNDGSTYHGSSTTNNDATGTWVYGGSVIGPYITATITDSSGNTSEFSAPVAYSPPAVGGIAELPNVSDSSAPGYIALAGLATAALGVLTAGAWYARRRWLR